MHTCGVPDYEYRAVRVPRDASREQTRDLLTIHAEYGDWELARHAIWPDGRRNVTVRRRLRPEPLPPMPS
ncbi:MAG: hypothetical protein QOE64_1884 [Frankiales bacterium]|nr:hypothetical protein [Frankiales bacterium]